MGLTLYELIFENLIFARTIEAAVAAQERGEDMQSIPGQHHLLDSVCIDASNVSAYFFEQYEGKDLPENMEDLVPNLAPLFPSVWWESRSMPKAFRHIHGIKGWGAHCQSIDLWEMYQAADPEERQRLANFTAQELADQGRFHIDGRPMEMAAEPILAEDTRWVSFWWLYFNENGRAMGPHLQCKVFLKPDGSVGLFEDGYYYAAQVSPMSASSKQEMMGAMTFIHSLFLATGFAHCKNVKMVKSALPHAKHRSRKREADEITFHVLQIEPMKKVLATEGNIVGNGLKKALHICRGHFSEYGDEFGKGKLFGKLEGRYWVPSHVRGSVEHGIADKDYAVKAPKGEAA